MQFLGSVRRALTSQCLHSGCVLSMFFFYPLNSSFFPVILLFPFVHFTFDGRYKFSIIFQFLYLFHLLNADISLYPFSLFTWSLISLLSSWSCHMHSSPLWTINFLTITINFVSSSFFSLKDILCTACFICGLCPFLIWFIQSATITANEWKIDRCLYPVIIPCL